MQPDYQTVMSAYISKQYQNKICVLYDLRKSAGKSA